MGKNRWVAWCSRNQKYPVKRKRSLLIRKGRTVFLVEIFAANQRQMAQWRPVQRQQCPHKYEVEFMSTDCGIASVDCNDALCWSWWLIVAWDFLLHVMFLSCEFPSLVADGVLSKLNTQTMLLDINLYSVSCWISLDFYRSDTKSFAN